jgi:hypothetical protein
MALKGTLDHPKLIALADALDLDPCFALGILEAVWHFTSAYAIGGDIGRFSDRAIATGIRTTINPQVLIKALVDTGWIDEDPECRLRVHDWLEHATKWVKVEAEKKVRGRPFEKGDDPRRNSDGRPHKTASAAEVSANEIQNAAKPKNETAKITASRARTPPYPTQPSHSLPNKESPKSPLRKGSVLGETTVLPWGVGLPPGVVRAELRRIDEENCDADIRDLDTGQVWFNFGPTWKLHEPALQAVEGGA